MKFCHNNSKKKHSPGLTPAVLRRFEQGYSNNKLRQFLAWSLSLASLLTVASAAQAQVTTSLDWGTGAGGEAEWIAGGGNGTQTYNDVGGSGVDVRVTVTNASGNDPTVDDNNVITPDGTEETLLVRLGGDTNGPATIDIEFFQTGTLIPAEVTNVSLPIYDVDQFPRPAGEVGWTDEVEISASSGGAPVAGVSAVGSAFNTVTPPAPQPAGNTVVIAQGDGGNAAADDTVTDPNVTQFEDGPFDNGTVDSAFAEPLDRVTIIFRDGPSDRDEAHAIAIGDITFTAATPTTPSIGLAKQASAGPTEVSPSIFEITYTLTVENTGTEALENVQIEEAFFDPLTNDSTFGDGNIVSSTVGAITPTGGANLTPNANYNVTAAGAADTNVLAAGGTLPVGASATIPITVQVDTSQPDFPDDVGNDGYNNQANASGTGETSGTPVEDPSDNGVEPDPNGDGDPGGPGEDDPTPVSFDTQPSIGLAKQASDGPTETNPGSGIFDITYTLTVENTGTEALENVQIEEAFFDPLTNDSTFGDGNIVSSTVGAITPTGGANLTANANYNVTAAGVFDANVLAAGGTLPVGASATIPITVQVDTNQPDFPDDVDDDGYNNQANASGTGETSGTLVEDPSDNGVEPDPNDDGNPGGPGEDDPTPVSFDPEPVIGIAKQLVSTVLASDGSFGVNTARVTYDIVVVNLGNERLNDVQITEDLNDTFGQGTFEVVNVTRRTGVTTVSPDFNPGTFDGDGTSDATMLAAGGTLEVDDSANFRLVVDVDTSSPNLITPLPGPYLNQAQATATGATSNEPTEDDSDDGTEVDPDGDGNPNEDNGNPDDPLANENTPTQVLFGPDLRLVKRITAVTRNGTPVNVGNINGFNGDNDPNNGDELLNTRSGGTVPLGLVNIATPLQSGDIVEYTIYFWNGGLGPADNLELCDELEVPSVLIPDSLELANPTTLSDAGTVLTFGGSALLSPRAPLSPLADSCISAPGNFPSGIPAGGLGVGAGGGVVVGGPNSNLNVAPNEVGAFRFDITLP